MLDVEEVFGEVLLLGARLWLAGLLRRVGPTPLVCLPISGAQWRQRNLAPAESQPRLLAASQVRPTCPCAESGFLYRVFSTDILDQIRRALPGGVSLSHAWHWDVTQASCESGEAEVLRRGAGDFCLSGACVFSGSLWFLFLCYWASSLSPCFPPLIAVGQ